MIQWRERALLFSFFSLCDDALWVVILISFHFGLFPVIQSLVLFNKMRYIISGNEGHRIKKKHNNFEKVASTSQQWLFLLWCVFTGKGQKVFHFIIYIFLDDFFLRASFVSEAELKEKSYSSCSFAFLFYLYLIIKLSALLRLIYEVCFSSPSSCSISQFTIFWNRI